MSLTLDNTESSQLTSDLRVSSRTPRTLSLLYHELRSGPSTYGYALSTATFREHLELFSRLKVRDKAAVLPAVTFDDGHVSNFDQALPALSAAGIGSRFFVTAGWTSVRAEYMTWEQLRELSRCGHQIGAHGWSHKLLTHCSDMELELELVQTRKVLEDKLGLPVTTLSLPGGRSNDRVLAACRNAGYAQVFTSVPQVQHSPTAFTVGRLNLRAGVTLPWLEAVLAPESKVLRKIEITHRVKGVAQRALGDRLYMKMWALLNRAEAGDHPE